MARINIEDDIYKDNRFSELIVRRGGLEPAIGALVRAWALAQKWYLTPDKMIPASEWDKQAIRNEIIEVGLASRVGDKIKMAGVDEQFSWLVARSYAGKQSSLKRLGNLSNDRQQVLNDGQPLPLPLPQKKEEEECTEVTNVTIGAIPDLHKGDIEIRKLLSNVKAHIQFRWIKLYPDTDWLHREMLKAINWVAANPRKRPQNIDRFLNHWFSKGWEYHRKTIPSASTQINTTPLDITKL